MASSIPGFSPDLHSNPLGHVRDLIKDHIDPIPLFFPQIVTLPNRNLVLIVYVPGGQDTPFVTKDGRIYRRTCDSSDPSSEANRYTLDLLYERGKQHEKNFEFFAQDKRVLNDFENVGWLNIYLSPYPPGSIFRANLNTASEISNLINKSKSPVPFILPVEDRDFPFSISCPFNVAIPTLNSLILRRTNYNEEQFHSLLLELDRHGRAKIFIPIHPSLISDFNLPSILSAKAHRFFTDLKYPPRDSCLKFFDISSIWCNLVAILNFYLDWLSQPISTMSFQICIEINDVFRFVPYCDLDSWCDHVEQFGLPVMLLQKSRYPNNPGDKFLHDFDKYFWIRICTDLSLIFGLPFELCVNSLLSTLSEALDKANQDTSP